MGYSKKTLRPLVFTLFVLCVAWGAWANEPAGVQVFRGEYTWNHDGHTNTVEATFTPTGEGQWDVVFDFKYARREGTYEGTVEGSLQDGAIAGDVKGAGDVIRYRLEAEVNGDRLEGKHYDIWEGRRKLYGTINLERVDPEHDTSDETTP